MQTWALHRGILCVPHRCKRELQGGSEQEATAAHTCHPKMPAFSTQAVGGGGGRHSDEVDLGHSVG